MKLKKKAKILLVVIAIFIVLLVSCMVYYTTSLNPVSSDKTSIPFTIKSGETSETIINNLKSKNLIKSTLATKIYVKVNKVSMQAGTYRFNKSMGTRDILSDIQNGNVSKDSVSVTFVEGKRLTDYADVISKNFPYTKDEVMSVLDDKTYVNELINKYSFLSTDILKDGIYHPLEGYLFPDTYEFKKDESIKGIIEKMLDNMGAKLSSLDSSIKSSSFSIHEIMTLASLVELEGAGTSDRAGIAGVFMNRLNSNMSLGSDVTTYYAVGKDFSSDLTKSELASCNGYNTRGTCVKGLPIGPIASPSLDAIKAAVNPTKSDYLFFVADKNGKVYYSKTSSEHDATISKLQSQGLWYTY